MATQMQTRIPVVDTTIIAEPEVLFKAKNLFIIFEPTIEVAHLENRTYPLRFHSKPDLNGKSVLAKIRVRIGGQSAGRAKTSARPGYSQLL
jgi:hypothetical protein